MNTQSTTDTYYIANTDVSTQLIEDDQAVIYHPDTNKEKYLNATGRFIWERLNGDRSIEEIANDLSSAFANTLTCAVIDDVNNFIGNLVSQGFADTFDEKELLPQKRLFPSINDGPNSVDISLTGRCNLRCKYCFYDDEMQTRPDLPKDDWLIFFRELGGLGVRDVCLSGGEVFLRPDLFELIDDVVSNRMRYSLLTNGTLITQKLLDRFKKQRRRLRLNSIQVSIDGSSPEVHDRSRGKGSFVKAIRGLRMLKEADFPVTARVTINRYNVDDLEKVTRLLLEDIGIPAFGTNDAMPMGAGCNNQESITLLPHQQVQAMQILSRLADEYDGRLTATAGPLAKLRSYREMERARATGQKATRWEMGYLTGCGCVFNKLSVHHDGTITPCNMLAKLALGKIDIDSLSKIWKNHPILGNLKSRRNIPMQNVMGCEQCAWGTYCNGSCPGLAYEMTGDLNNANPHDCYRKFLDETGSNSILNTE